MSVTQLLQGISKLKHTVKTHFTINLANKNRIIYFAHCKVKWHVPYKAGVTKKNKTGQANSVRKTSKMHLQRQLYKDKTEPSFIPLYVHFSKDHQLPAWEDKGCPFWEGSGWEIRGAHRGSVSPTALQQPCLHESHGRFQGSFSASY